MSVLKQMISLRDRYSSYLERATGVMNGILKQDAFIENHFEAMDDITCQTEVVNNDDFLKFKDKTGNILASFNLSQDWSDDQVQQKLLAQSVTSDYTVGDLLSQGGISADLYQVIATMLTKFSYANRISSSEINMMFSSVTSSEDVAKFKNALYQSIDDNGYMSSASFISMLQAINEVNHDSLEDGDSFEVDRSNPFKIATLFAFIVENAPTAFNSLLIATRSSVGAILAVIYGVFNLLFTMISNIFSSKLKYDRSVGNIMANAPILALDSPKVSGSSIIDDYLQYEIQHPTAHDRSVYAYEENGLCLFKWWNQTYTDFRFNGYDFPYYDPFKVMKKLLQDGWITKDSGNSIIINQHSSQYDLWDEIIYTDGVREQFADCSYDVLGYQPTNEMEILFSIIVSYWIRTNIEISRQGLMDGTLRTVATDDLAIQAFNDPDEQVFQVPGSIAANLSHNSEYWNDPRKLLTKNNYIQMYGYISDQWCKLVNERFLAYNSIIGGQPTAHYKMLGYDDTTYYKWYMPFSSFVGTTFIDYDYEESKFSLNWNSSIQERTYKPDCLPQLFGISYPEVIGSDLAASLGAFALVVTAGAITTGIVRKAIQKRSLSRNALKISKLNERRDAFLADPTNTEKRKAFEDAAYSYNKWGRIFGWGSYDGANGWYNQPSTDASESSRNFINSMSVAGSQDNLLIEIRNLIKAVD